uniref:ATP-grasp domain-containing protein n=1 Tax=uncultured bacterium A1Q1_fos_1000 TaxID=1256536 RepID=L7VZ65_9BACT|nr:protein of unknown function DUF201 [uncultured bacterium A1Q1_fos_1000]
MTSRDALLKRIDESLGERCLVWFGIRGSDAGSLLQLRQFRDAFSITDALPAAKMRTSVALEDLTGRRVDLDSYDIDYDDGPHVQRLRLQILTLLRQQAAVAAYRPSHFLSAIGFASFPAADMLGLFKDRQTAFEHKPWVETELQRRGIRTVEWSYVAAEHRHVIRERLSAGPLVLRPNRTSGGAGVLLLNSEDQLDQLPTDDSDHFVGVSDFMGNAIPLNVGAVVWASGQITLHPASIQLIGLPSCTSRRFGYCGNDFAAFELLDPSVVTEVEALTLRIGTWLANLGYLGAFGVDYLLNEDTLLFAEINARLQGSTAVSAAMAARAGHSDIVLEHVAAGLGLEPVMSMTLQDWASELPPTSQVIVHNARHQPARVEGTPSTIAKDWRIELTPSRDLFIEPGAVIARIVAPRQVTRTGFELDAYTEDLVQSTYTSVLGVP